LGDWLIHYLSRAERLLVLSLGGGVIVGVILWKSRKLLLPLIKNDSFLHTGEGVFTFRFRRTKPQKFFRFVREASQTLKLRLTLVFFSFRARNPL